MNNVPSRGLVIMLDKVLPEIIRVIQGDGISYNSLALCGGRGAARLDDASNAGRATSLILENFVRFFPGLLEVQRWTRARSEVLTGRKICPCITESHGPS